MIHDLDALLARIGTLLRAELRVEATRAGLAVAQLDILYYLAHCNRFSDSPAAVAEYVGATKGTTSKTLMELVERGLVERLVHAGDARMVRCHPTEAGRALLKRTRPPPQVAAGLAAADPQLVPLLDGLVRSLQRHNGRRAFGVCRTCVHHRPGEEGASCGLFQEPLAPEEGDLLCREFVAPDAAAQSEGG